MGHVEGVIGEDRAVVVAAVLVVDDVVEAVDHVVLRALDVLGRAQHDLVAMVFVERFLLVEVVRSCMQNISVYLSSIAEMIRN